MMAATDARFFTGLCERVYRFAPFRMTKAQREAIHSYDERIGVDDLVAGVGWYQHLIERLPLDDHARPARRRRIRPVHGLVAVVGFLVMVEVASGVLQGYYTPIYPQIAEHLSIPEGDVNWFEAAQLIVSALCIPILARLGDLVGHKKVLLLSTAVTALGSWILAFAPSFTTFLIGWAVQGAYVVWLPLEIAIIHRRTRASGRQELLTRRGAAVLVGALELAVIIGAVTSGLLVDTIGMNVLLALPAMVVTAVFFVILFGIEDAPGESTGGIDWVGFGLITLALSLVMAGLVLIRVDGAGSVQAWLWSCSASLCSSRSSATSWGWPSPSSTSGSSPARAVAGAADGVPVRHPGARRPDPAVDVRPGRPGVRGYGLGADSAFISTLIGLYVITLAIGAFTLPLTSRLLGVRRRLGRRVLDGRPRLPALAALPRGDLAGADQHGHRRSRVRRARRRTPCRRGCGRGASDRTGIATGMTNGTKTLGGAIASAVFAIALAATGSLDAAGEEVAPLRGYLTVWAVCSGAAFLAALALLAAPRHAFSDRPLEAGVSERPPVRLRPSYR